MKLAAGAGSRAGRGGRDQPGKAPVGLGVGRAGMKHLGGADLTRHKNKPMRADANDDNRGGFRVKDIAVGDTGRDSIGRRRRLGVRQLRQPRQAGGGQRKGAARESGHG